MKVICQTTVLVVCFVIKVVFSGPPQCPVIYDEHISVSTPVGSAVVTLVCTDPDGDVITYQLIDGDDDGVFRLQGNQIILAKTVVPSIIYKFVLEVHAVDPGGERGFTSVNIGISSPNDYGPVVTWTPNPIYVKESAPIGTLVGQCTVRDDDITKGTLAGETLVDFLKPDIRAANKWLLDKTTCHLYINDKLDFDTKQAYTLTMVAYDLDPYSPRTVTHQITIIVTNEPDSMPKCSKAYRIGHIARTTSIGEEITRIECTDDDVGVAGQITYQIDETNTRDIKELFQIQPSTGSLTLKTPITSDSIPSYEILVNVKDGGTPSYSSKVLVRVIVTDVPQDGLLPPSRFTNVFSNPVLFSRPSPIDTRHAPPVSTPGPHVGFPLCPRYSVTAIISEGNPIFEDLYDFGCTDPEGDNLMYFITRGNVYDKFKIVGSKLQLEKPLNADGRDRYHLRIIVHDDSRIQLSTTLTIAVLVTNINDNPPVIRDLPPNIEVSEKAQFGTIVYKCDISDKDDANEPAGQTRIAWQNPDDPATKFWLLDSVTCDLYVNAQLDYEKQAVYNLGVVVRDLDPTTPLTSTYTFTIQVTDENEPPVCQPSYTVKLPSNSFVGTSVTGVICTDADSGENGRITYMSAESNSATIQSQFGVSSSGMVFLQRSLNSDPSLSYQVNVVAFDGGTPSLSSTSTVLIIKGSAPTCGNNKSLSVDLTSPIGTVVTDLQCSDADPGDTLTYSFISGNTGGHFSIDNGMVKLAKQFETIYRFLLDIQVMDESSAKVSVRVAININDYPPVVTGMSDVLSVMESTPVGTVISTCTVTDGDQVRGTPAGQTQLALTNIDGTAASDWSLGQDCQLRINTGLDYETRSNYTLVLLAWDLDPIAPKTSSVTFTVSIGDLNDNNPICTTIFRVDIQENTTSIGAVVDSISCTDADSGNNGQVYFKLSDINTAFVKSSFLVNRTTGQVELTTVLDYEKRTSHQVTIVAEDGGAQSLSTTITVLVNVINIDDVPTTTTSTTTTTTTTTTTIPTSTTTTTPSTKTITTTIPSTNTITTTATTGKPIPPNTEQTTRESGTMKSHTTRASSTMESHTNGISGVTTEDPSSKPVNTDSVAHTSQHVITSSAVPVTIFTSNVPPKFTTTYPKTTKNYPPLPNPTGNSGIPPNIGTTPSKLTSKPLTQPPVVSTGNPGPPPPVTSTMIPPHADTTKQNPPPDKPSEFPNTDTRGESTVKTRTSESKNSAALIHIQKLVVLVNIILTVRVITV